MAQASDTPFSGSRKALSKLATAALVLGLLSLLTGLFGIGLFIAPFAVVCARFAHKSIAASPDRLRGNRQATAGLVLALATLLLAPLFFYLTTILAPQPRATLPSTATAPTTQLEIR